ncbi:hypothetical protein BH11BAC4_BH11BAC4_24110 [soil metagenome]
MKREIKKIPFLLLFICITASVFGQDVSFREIRRKAKTTYINNGDTTIIYPIIVTKNKQVEKIINDAIRSSVFEPEDLKKNQGQDLNAALETGLISLSYEVSFRRNGILSMNIFMEGCGAYCSSYTKYFNFDLRTGKTIGLKDIFKAGRLDSFSARVLEDKRKFLEAYLLEEEKNIPEIIDTSSFSIIKEKVTTDCMKTVEMENFSLSKSAFEITDPCEFPHILRSQEPIYELKYSYKDLEQVMNPAIRNRLMK